MEHSPIGNRICINFTDLDALFADLDALDELDEQERDELMCIELANSDELVKEQQLIAAGHHLAKAFSPGPLLRCGLRLGVIDCSVGRVKLKTPVARQYRVVGENLIIELYPGVIDILRGIGLLNNKAVSDLDLLKIAIEATKPITSDRPD